MSLQAFLKKNELDRPVNERGDYAAILAGAGVGGIGAGVGADDIDNPYTRGEVGREDDYYPGPAPRRR